MDGKFQFIVGAAVNSSEIQMILAVVCIITGCFLIINAIKKGK